MPHGGVPTRRRARPLLAGFLFALALSACGATGGTGGAPVLSVSPPTGHWTTGNAAGLRPAEKAYQLFNRGNAELRWRASASAPWVRLSAAEGLLPPGGKQEVLVSVAPDGAETAVSGKRRAEVRFENLSGGPGGTVRTVEWVATGAAADAAASVSAPEDALLVQRFGITWMLPAGTVHGTFANGDPWVVGPVDVLAIKPASFQEGGRTRNGSMVNPSPRLGWSQGFDSAAYGKYAGEGSYRPALNVALGVTPEKPLHLPPHSSLVSTLSDPQAGARPQVLTAAILTVLPEAPPEQSFRPPYCGKQKPIRHRVQDLQLDRLASLAPVPSTPPLADVERMFERPWIDHVPGWIGRYVHPKGSMPDYGREIADHVGNAALMLHLDLPVERKHKLLVSFVQCGIDLYGVLRDGGERNWQAGDGHHSGRKWPILFAGIMLGDPDMSGIGQDPGLLFMGEDGQTFYVEETSPGVYNGGHGGYDRSHVGLAEWGKKHALRPELDAEDWLADPYRGCCTANVWYGQLLAARIMGAVDLWNHDALFDYQDRYLRTARQRKQEDWVISWSRFPLEMWERYRAKF